MAYSLEDESVDHTTATRAALLTSARALVAHLTRTLPPQPLPSPDDVFTAPPRVAAVLAPIYALGDRPHLLFTRRAPTLTSHSGEISFPGGARDAGDSTILDTALRESREELGIAPANVTMLGYLPPVFTVVSNFLINPVVGWLGELSGELSGELTPNPAEVAEVIEAPLVELADPAIFHVEQWMRGGVTHPVYFYQLGEYRIWGATARVLHHLFACLPT